MWELLWSLHGFLSRILAGGALGCAALLMVNLVFPVPFWEPLYKGDERWRTVFLMAEMGLPTAFTLGALGGLAWRWSRPFRLGPAELFGCCLAVALVSALLRPAVARIRTGGRGPLYEVVPDTMAAIFGLGALAIAVVAIGGSVIPRSTTAAASGGRVAKAPDADASAAADPSSEMGSGGS